MEKLAVLIGRNANLTKKPAQPTSAIPAAVTVTSRTNSARSGREQRRKKRRHSVTTLNMTATNTCACVLVCGARENSKTNSTKT